MSRAVVDSQADHHSREDNCPYVVKLTKDVVLHLTILSCRVVYNELFYALLLCTTTFGWFYEMLIFKHCGFLINLREIQPWMGLSSKHSQCYTHATMQLYCNLDQTWQQCGASLGTRGGINKSSACALTTHSQVPRGIIRRYSKEIQEWWIRYITSCGIPSVAPAVVITALVVTVAEKDRPTAGTQCQQQWPHSRLQVAWSKRQMNTTDLSYKGSVIPHLKLSTQH